MKNLALDLDTGKLTSWIGAPSLLTRVVDRYGDLYRLNVEVYKSSGGKIPTCSLQFLVKKPQRFDVKALWDYDGFTRNPSFTSVSTASFTGQIDVSGENYRIELGFDSSPENDKLSATFLGILRAVTTDGVVENDFEYVVENSGYRLADVNFGLLYVGISDEGGLLVRNADNNEWRELNVLGSGSQVSFALGSTVLGPEDTAVLNDTYVRINNGILQIKNEDNSEWTNIILRGGNGGTVALGSVPSTGFAFSNNRYSVTEDGRLLLRNLTTGDWHELKVGLSEGTDVLVLGDIYEDTNP
jgi:hypothetical protein